MLTKLIAWLEKKLAKYQTYRQHPGTNVPAEPKMTGQVLRFQGRYDCGLEWPLDKLAPEECPTHGEGCERVYSHEKKFNVVPRLT
jgi:hypothetical protein